MAHAARRDPNLGAVLPADEVRLGCLVPPFEHPDGLGDEAVVTRFCPFMAAAS
jgi:hypothetical protein